MRKALIVLVLVQALAVGQEPLSVDKLIEQLGSKSFPQRERATKALRERGPSALSALRKALESKDEEVRKRAESLIPALEIEEALLPKRVTLKTDGKSSTELFKEIEKQTGYKLSAPGAGNPTRKYDLKDEPFWETLDRLGYQAQRTSDDSNRVHTVHLQSATNRSPHLNIRGPFRLEATRFHEDRDIDFTQSGPDAEGWRHRRLTLAVSVLVEPRITFLKVSPAKVVEALDSDGKSLLETPDVSVDQKLLREGRSSFRGESLVSSDIRLRRASESAKTARIIRGTIPVRAVVIRKSVVVTSKLMEATGVSFRAGQDSLQISRVSNQGGGSTEVEIIVPYDRNGPQREWHDRFHAEDDAGNRMQTNGRGTSSNGSEYRNSMYFAPPFNKKNVGAPTRLVFEDWIIHEYEIPFEFKDIALP